LSFCIKLKMESLTEVPETLPEAGNFLPDISLLNVSIVL